MPIWIHQDCSDASAAIDDVVRQSCRFCNAPLKGWQAKPDVHRNFSGFFFYCCACGWWTRFVTSVWEAWGEDFCDDMQTFRKTTDRLPRIGDNGRKGEPIVLDVVGCHAILRTLSLDDIETPTNEVRDYLIAKYQDRFDVHWRKFEEVVAGVFSDMGYEVMLGSGHADGGVDIIMHSPGGDLIGVQVKKSRRAIEVEQIQSFFGALVDKGITEGVFVTTSHFRAGATAQAERYSVRHAKPIRLLDAPRFFDALKLSTAQPDYSNWIQDTSGFPDFVLCKPLPVYLESELPVGFLLSADLSKENNFTIQWPSLGGGMIPPLTKYSKDPYHESFPIGAAGQSTFWGMIDQGFEVEEFLK